MMCFHNLFVLLMTTITASAVHVFSDPVGGHDFNGTFIIFDVRADKSSGGSLKTAFSNLKNVEYGVKFTGEERALFVVRDDDTCSTIQADFHGLNVDTLPARSSDLPVVLSDNGLVVMVIETSLDGDSLDQAFQDALERCDGCFKIFAVAGNKPQKCILIGNMPLDQVGDIARNTTTDNCCDTVYTKRATNFRTLHQACVDPHRKTVSVPVHKLVKKPFHKPIPGIPFPDNVATKDDTFGPIHPLEENIFPVHQIKPHRIVDPHLTKADSVSQKDKSFRPHRFGPPFELDDKPDKSIYGIY